MSVIVKGMEMPKSCGRCWFNYSSLSCAITGSCIDRDDENRERLDDCPLGELPDKNWIPCSERLPKVDEKVLTTTVLDDVTTAWRIGVDKWFINEGETNATIEDLIAWMPLPEPYKGGTNG